MPGAKPIRRAVSKAQQALFAIALHDPAKISKQNRQLTRLPKMTLREFAETPARNLPRHMPKR